MSWLRHKKSRIRLQIALAATLGLPLGICSDQSRQSASPPSLPHGFKLVEPDEPEMPFMELRANADTGDAKAQSALGYRYALGKGVPKDTVEAFRWLQRAVEQGETYATNRLGWIYLQGQGVAKDPSEALKWFLLCAQNGDVRSQKDLGEIYQGGLGVPQDFAESRRWFEKAALQIPKPEDHDVDALLNRIFISEARHELGEVYSQGTGVEQDDAEGFKWFKKAADLGDSDSQWTNWTCRSPRSSASPKLKANRSCVGLLKSFDSCAAQNIGKTPGRSEISDHSRPRRK
jgi:TPR repeat protein